MGMSRKPRRRGSARIPPIKRQRRFAEGEAVELHDHEVRRCSNFKRAPLGASSTSNPWREDRSGLPSSQGRGLWPRRMAAARRAVLECRGDRSTMACMDLGVGVANVKFRIGPAIAASLGRLLLHSPAHADQAWQNADVVCSSHSELAVVRFGMSWNDDPPQYAKLPASVDGGLSSTPPTKEQTCRLPSGRIVRMRTWGPERQDHGVGGGDPQSYFDLWIGSRQVGPTSSGSHELSLMSPGLLPSL